MISDNYDQAVEAFRRKYGTNKERAQWALETEFAVVCIPKEEGVKIKTTHLLFMHLTPWAKADTIAHESFHMLFYLAKHVGFNIDFESQEWSAHMLSYIIRCVEKEVLKAQKLQNTK